MLEMTAQRDGGRFTLGWGIARLQDWEWEGSTRKRTGSPAKDESLGN